MLTFLSSTAIKELTETLPKKLTEGHDSDRQDSILEAVALLADVPKAAVKALSPLWSMSSKTYITIIKHRFKTFVFLERERGRAANFYLPL